MRKINRVGGLAALALFGVVLSSPATALTLAFTGDTGVTGTADFDFYADGANVRLRITLTNTSPIISDLRGIVFNIEGAGISYVAGSFNGTEGDPNLAWYLYEDGSLPPFGTFDLCGQTENAANGKCNAGISTDGLDAPPNTSDSFSIGVTGWGGTGNLAVYLTHLTTLYNDQDTANVCLRYQAISSTGSLNRQTSDKVCSDGSSTPDEPLPEPGTLALLGLGLVGLGMSRRRRQA